MSLALAFIPAMWGPNPYTRVSDFDDVTTISDATHRFVHGEIEHAEQYQSIMENVMNKIYTEECSKFEDDVGEIKRACCLRVNKRLFGKTPLEMFISIESLVLLAEEKTPEAAYRLSMKRTFEGIFALYQAVGKYIDTDDENEYGVPDVQTNIAGLCALFPVDVYDKTVASDGSLRFMISLRKTFVPRKQDTPLVSSTIFLFIQLLWPSVCSTPFMNPESIQIFVGDLQMRHNNSIDPILQTMNETRLDNGSTHLHVDMDKLFDMGKDPIDVDGNISHMMQLRAHKIQLSTADLSAIAKADAIALPVVTVWMNRARMITEMAS